MSLAKRALELGKKNPLRKRIEEFLNPELKKQNEAKALSIRKGDIVKLKMEKVLGGNGVGVVTKYSSNKEIWVALDSNDRAFSNQFCKEDIECVFGLDLGGEGGDKSTIVEIGR